MSIILKKKIFISKKWLKVLRFFNKNGNFNKNFIFIKSRFNRSKFIIMYNYINSTIIQNECNALRVLLDVRVSKLDVIKFYDIKNINSKNRVHFILSNIHKIIFSKGYYIKIIQILNSILKDINLIFFDSCFINHMDSFKTNFNSNTELYVFKYYYNIMSDFCLIENNDYIKWSTQSLLYDTNLTNFNNIDSLDKSYLVNFNDNDEEAFFFINRKKNINTMNIFFKYFFNNICVNWNFFNIINYDNIYLKNFFFNIYNKNFNINILSFTKQYFLLLFTNYKKLHYEQYINYLNNFFSINHFLYKIFFKINFIFKLQLKSLSKKMRKILKNKRRYTLVYTYIKPHKRLNVLLYYIKKFILLSDGKDLKEKLNNTFLSLLLDNNDSWVYQLYAKQQVQCVTNIRYRRG
jgi:hypothetical protein